MASKGFFGLIGEIIKHVFQSCQNILTNWSMRKIARLKTNKLLFKRKKKNKIQILLDHQPLDKEV